MNKIITIVTPSFNQGQYISQTIESVLAQAGNFFIDYIIADGGSTDNTVEVIKKYEQRLNDKNWPIKCQGITLTWWSHKDAGQTDAINQGFKVAKGDILAYINSDDLYFPGAFQKVLKAFSKNNQVELVYGKCLSFWQDSSKTLENIPPADLTFKKILRGGPRIFQPASFWTKKIYDKVGLLDKDCHYAMDYEYYLRILSEPGAKAFFLDEFLAKFRVVSGQKSQQERKLIDEFVAVNRKYNDGKLSWYVFKQKIKEFLNLI